MGISPGFLDPGTCLLSVTNTRVFTQVGMFERVDGRAHGEAGDHALHWYVARQGRSHADNEAPGSGCSAAKCDTGIAQLSREDVGDGVWSSWYQACKFM